MSILCLSAKTYFEQYLYCCEVSFYNKFWMSDYRISVAGENQFNPYEWLRRDVLWASLVTPYDKQLAGWLDEDLTQREHHVENINNQAAHETAGDPDLEAQAFFHQGKSVAGVISSIALIETLKAPTKYTGFVDPLECQARSVKRVLRAAETPADTRHTPSLKITYDKSARFIRQANNLSGATYARNIRLDKAARLMIRYAAHSTRAWLAAAAQSETGDLPVLIIPNGGESRSSGPHVELLLPTFNKTVQSPAYQALNT